MASLVKVFLCTLLYLCSLALSTSSVQASESEALAMTLAMDITSWNHTKNYPDEFSGLAEPLDEYEIRSINATEQPTYLKTRLVKKLVNSTRQHSNGIKFTFNKPMLKFADVSAMVLKLKIKFSQLNSIDKDALEHFFSDEKTQQRALAALLYDKNDDKMDGQIDGKVHVNVTFFGEFNDQPAVTTWYGRQIIAIDKQAKDSDWLTFKIKMSELAYYQQQNWQEVFVSAQQAASHKLSGLLITAESKNGKTISSYFPDDLSANHVEQFIELPIELQWPEFTLRQ